MNYKKVCYVLEKTHGINEQYSKRVINPYLTLDIINGVSMSENIIQSCIKKYVGGYNQVSEEIISLPKYLTIQTKRFKYNDYGVSIKLNTTIRDCEELDLGIHGNYRLLSVVVHMGTTPRGGHYYTYRYLGDNQYVELNDSIVINRGNYLNIKNIVEGDANNTGYIYLYVRRRK